MPKVVPINGNQPPLTLTKTFDQLGRSLKTKLVNTITSAVGNRFPSGRVVTLIAVACAIASASSGYLGWVALTSSKVAGCGGGRLFNCGHVISSRWSLWMGIPVSLLALGLYACVAAALVVGSSAKFSDPQRRIAWAIISMLGLAAGMTAIWFISLQVFALKHLCTYCLVAHTCSLIIAGTVLFTRPVGTAALKSLSLLSIAATFVLIGGQLLTKAPKTYRLETFDSPETESEVFEFSAPIEPTDSGKTNEPSMPSIKSDGQHRVLYCHQIRGQFATPSIYPRSLAVRS